jgi:hypothetical protein
MKQAHVDLEIVDRTRYHLSGFGVATQSLSGWMEITELDFTLYGQEYAEAAVGFVAALRFQNIPDQSILRFVEREGSPSLLLDTDTPGTDQNHENQWATSNASILAVANLSAAQRAAIYRTVELMIHSKLCRQAGLLE